MAYPQQYPQPVYVVRPPLPPYSALAVAGFVLSLVWAFGFLSPFGLALSIAGLHDASRTGKRGGPLAAWGIGLGIVGTLWLSLWVASWIGVLSDG